MNYKNYRQKQYIPNSIGKFQIPLIVNQDYKDAPFISFNQCLTEKDCNKNVHFFIDDYQFERCWRNPEMYANILKKFCSVLSPDFSMWTDMPVALQLYNHYRKQYLGAYWQQRGVKVIPTINWSDESSFDFCFDGYEKKGTVAVSVLGSKHCVNSFMRGYDKMIEILEPNQILVYGDLKNLNLHGNIKNIKTTNFYRK